MPQRTTPRRREASPDPVGAFIPGDPVEVLPEEPGLRGVHFTAVVVARSTNPRGYTVEYDARFEPGGSDRPLREVVPARILRPQRPPCWAPGSETPAEHAAVDALLNGAWWLGVALGGADGNGKVRVCFPDIREVVEFDATEVRPHLEWGLNGWKQRSAEGMAKPETVPYTKRMNIEVSKLEDNSVVAWLPAVVAKTFWKNNLLVMYTHTVSKSDGTALFEEIVDVKHVRPCPPQPTVNYLINDEVEAFQGSGWWAGVITHVHPEFNYTFKYAHLGVEVQLSRIFLRPRYDWIYPWKQESQNAFNTNFTQGLVSSHYNSNFGGAWFEVAGSKDTATPRGEKQHNNPSFARKSTTAESSYPTRAFAIKKRKTQADGPPDPAPSLTKKHESPKLGPSEENKRRESSSKDIYPDLHENCPLSDVPRPNDQAGPAPQPEATPAPAPQPEPTPAPAQRRKAILKMSLPITQLAAAPEATVSPPTWGSDAQKNEAVQNTPPEVGTCSNSLAKSLHTPLDAIIEDLKGCREQWLKFQSQLDHSATNAKELEAQVAKLRSASEAGAKHLREAMDKQASLEQALQLKDKEIQDLKKKLADLDEQVSCVEAELPRGAVMAASHALGVLKNHLPDLDIGIVRGTRAHLRRPKPWPTKLGSWSSPSSSALGCR